MSNATIELVDTFNNRVISRHRSVAAAGKASRAYDRALKRANGNSSYIPMIPRDAVTGENLVDSVEWIRAINGAVL